MSYNAYTLEDNLFAYDTSLQETNDSENDYYYCNTIYSRSPTSTFSISPPDSYLASNNRHSTSNGLNGRQRYSGIDSGNYAKDVTRSTNQPSSRHVSDCQYPVAWNTSMVDHSPTESWNPHYQSTPIARSNSRSTDYTTSGSVFSHGSNDSNSEHTITQSNRHRHAAPPTPAMSCSPNDNISLYCHHSECLGPSGELLRRFSRKADVARHYKSAHEPDYKDCPHKRCERKGSNGFTRDDHLTEHLRGYHGEKIAKRCSGRHEDEDGTERAREGQRWKREKHSVSKREF